MELVEDLIQWFESPNPSMHPLCETCNELTPEEVEKLINSYDIRIERMMLFASGGAYIQNIFVLTFFALLPTMTGFPDIRNKNTVSSRSTRGRGIIRVREIIRGRRIIDSEI